MSKPNEAHVALVAEMLGLQSEVNDLIDSTWRVKDYPYLDAVFVEAVECKDHLENWKWWKKSSPITASMLWQCKLELVDIAHFLWAELLRKHIAEGVLLTTPEDLARKALDRYTVEFNLDEDSLDAVLLRGDEHYIQALLAEMHVVFRSLVAAAASGDVWKTLTQFYRIMHYFGMTIEDLHELYMPKNVLNIFRQHANYNGKNKDLPAYIKNWKKVQKIEEADGSIRYEVLEGTVEDNVVLEELVADLKASARVSGSEFNKKMLYDSLKERYMLNHTL